MKLNAKYQKLMTPEQEYQTLMTNTEILCWILGWQGGTLQQVSNELETTETVILAAEGECLRDLCRRAQLICRRRILMASKGISSV